jgi:hypothetical protein
LIKISNQLNFYLNGVLVATEITNGPISPSNFGYFGSTSSDFSTLFEGHLDDIAIYNRALTPEEVQQLYTLDACTFTVYDTLYTYETVYDTLTTYETLYDTLITYETLYDTLTTYETVYDTLTTYETLYDTLTTYETIVDTLYEYETITSYDTLTTYITVTDTLLIDITLTSVEGQPGSLNTVTVYPNPASDHITIDYGNFALMSGYNTVITDAAGATVYSSAVNSQQVEVDINAWGAMGVYYMMIYDLNGALVAVRQIVLE